MSELADRADLFWVVSAAALVVLMQGGFCCLESGLVRAKNKINVGAKNLVDFCAAGVVYWAFGYAVMFGTGSSLLGLSGFMFGSDAEPSDHALFLFQMTFAGTAATIVSGAIAERIRFSRYIVITIFVSGVIYPVYGHWVWGGIVPGGQTGWLADLGFLDFAGGSVVHATAGWTSLAAVIVLGPRRGRFVKGNPPIEGNDLTLATFGVLLIWVGWFGFNGGSTLAASDTVPLILLNTNLAGCAGGLAGLVIARIKDGVFKLQDTMNGAIAGLVAITAGAPFVSPGSALLIGGIGGIVAFLGSRWLLRLNIDDVIGAVSAHAMSGAWGTLAVALFGDSELWGTGHSRTAQLGVQSLGLIAGFGWAFGVSLVVLWLVDKRLSLRVAEADEHVGLNVAEHGADTPAVLLLQEMEQQRRNPLSRSQVSVEPHTEVGLIATQYNRVVERVAQEERRVRELTDELVDAHQSVVAILNSAGEGICGIDLDGKITFINPAGASMLGHVPDDLLGLQAHDLLHRSGDGSCAGATCPIASVRNWGEPRKVVNDVFRLADGTQLPVSSVTTPVLDTEESVSGLVVTYRDLTVEKELEAQILQAQKLESVGQLAAGIAHEINTPMQYIGDNTHFLKATVTRLLSVAEAAEQATGDEATSEDLVALQEVVARSKLSLLAERAPKAADDALSGVENVSRIVTAMKRFSHPGSEHMEPVDLNEAIATTMTVCRNEWKYAAEVETCFEDDLPLIEGRLGPLNQVWLNMIVNATHAIADRHGDGKGLISIATESVGEGLVRVVIADNGAGISGEHCDRIFDHFFTTKEVGKGTGQGLAIAHQVITTEHNGTITVESVVGQGTTFTITLPTTQPQTKEPAVATGGVRSQHM